MPSFVGESKIFLCLTQRKMIASTFTRRIVKHSKIKSTSTTRVHCQGYYLLCMVVSCIYKIDKVKKKFLWIQAAIEKIKIAHHATKKLQSNGLFNGIRMLY